MNATEFGLITFVKTKKSGSIRKMVGAKWMNFMLKMKERNYTDAYDVEILLKFKMI